MKISRRSFLIKFFLGLIGTITTVWLDSFWFEKYIVHWKRYDLSGTRSDSIKTIQLSDLHLTAIKSFHRSLAYRVNKEKPDILFITGDSVSRNHQLRLLDEFLGFIDQDIVKIAILGNTEYRGVDLKELKDVYQRHNGYLLVNEKHYLKIGKRTINIIGVDDLYSGNANFHIPASDSDATMDTIVLVHRPAYREEIDRINRDFELPIKMILSGHTHGGQIVFFGNVTFTPKGSGKYVKGWYENEHSRMFVSKGIGTTILPIRLGARAEAIIFHV